MPYCSNCGAQNPDTAKFCVNCGHPMSAATEATPVQPSSPSVAPAQTSLVGSKVSFVASDGKTYSGTIKEIQGDQYKIKYDAFDFETWLTKNQFTVVGGSTTPAATVIPPSYSAVPNAQVTFSSTSTATSNQGAAILTHLGFWGSILILIGFFTDWINPDYMPYGRGSSGFLIIKEAFENLSDVFDNELGAILFIAILVIIISGIICLLYILGVGLGRGIFVFFKLLPLLAIIGFIVYCVIKVKEAGADPDVDSSVFKVLGIGLYLTLAGSVLLAISRSRK